MAAREPYARFIRAAQSSENDEASSASLRAMDDAMRARSLAQVVRLGWSIIRSRSDFARLVTLRDPPASDLEHIWQRLQRRRSPS
jgi:hypothetical protein